MNIQRGTKTPASYYDLVSPAICPADREVADRLS